MTYYCTLSGAKRMLQAGANAVEDIVLFAYLPVAAQRIEDYCGQNFDVRYEAHAFSAEMGAWEPRLFLRHWPLLEVTTILNGDGTTIDAANFQTLPRYLYPKTHIRLDQGYYWRGPDDTTSTTACGTSGVAQTLAAYAVDAIEIPGFWGFVRHYATCWQAIAATVSGAHTATATTLTLSAVAGALVDAGSILRIKKGVDYEQVAVVGPLSGAASSASLTIERGYNNTTALALVGAETIEVFRQDTTIELAAQKIAAALYEGRNNPSGNRVSLSTMGIDVSVPDTIPPDVKSLLQYPYRNLARGGF